MAVAHDTYPTAVDELTEAVLATVAYSDVFDAAVDLDRIHRWLLGPPCTVEAVLATAHDLVDEGRLGCVDGWYHLPGRAHVVAISRDRAERAARWWPVARRWVDRIARVPFVRMVGVTGGLACDSVEDHDDIDLIVLARTGRVWTCRALTAVVVRIAETRGVVLCPNYVLSVDSLALDPGVYVARELVQMRPMVGPEAARQLIAENDWVNAVVPNANPDEAVDRCRPLPQGAVHRAVERLLSVGGLDLLERWEMRRRSRRLARVESPRIEVGRPSESAFGPSVCKGHLDANGSAIATAWSDRLRSMEPTR